MADWQVEFLLLQVTDMPGLPHPADWKLNISFVSQGWAFIQSWFGIQSECQLELQFQAEEKLKTQLAGMYGWTDL